MKEVYYALTKGKSLVSKTIEWWTRSYLSHALFIDDTKIKHDIITDFDTPELFIEMWSKPNESIFKMRCIRSDITYHSKGTVFHIYSLQVTDKQYQKIHEFQSVCSYLEIPYDWKAIIAFVIPRKLKRDGHLFCSEKECLSLKYAGVIPKDIECWKVSPDRFKDLLLAKGAKLVKTIET